jgi:glycosyltransferase involved in cell wall biosynthesis
MRHRSAEFRFVGAGPEEGYITSKTSHLPNVRVYSQDVRMMPSEFYEAHIVVIPTLASEGTSLSCVEAMANGCAVLVTEVGGLGNLVIPDFNGVMCEPTSEAVEAKLETLLTNFSKSREIALNAHNVARASFSPEMWQTRIKAIITSLSIERTSTNK